MQIIGSGGDGDQLLLSPEILITSEVGIDDVDVDIEEIRAQTVVSLPPVLDIQIRLLFAKAIKLTSLR